jgi:hypothetical protein
VPYRKEFLARPFPEILHNRELGQDLFPCVFCVKAFEENKQQPKNNNPKNRFIFCKLRK